MMKDDKPITDIIPVGEAGYQLYTHTYRGEVEYRADFGIIWKDRKNRRLKLLPWMTAESSLDILAAAQIAHQELEKLRNAAIRQEYHSNNASVTPLTFCPSETEDSAVPEAPQELKLVNE